MPDVHTRGGLKVFVFENDGLAPVLVVHVVGVTGDVRGREDGCAACTSCR